MANEIGSSGLLDTWGSSGTRVEPDLTKKEQGWLAGERPAHEYMNWIHAEFGKKINHIFKNGVGAWNADTAYDAGSLVSHQGELWKSATTNTNSEPSDANSDWIVAWMGEQAAGSINTPGWFKLPNGVIQQWGRGTTDGNGQLVQSLPITFPTVHLVGLAVATGGSSRQANLFELSISQVDVRSYQNDQPVPNTPVNWVAWGK